MSESKRPNRRVVNVPNDVLIRTEKSSSVQKSLHNTVSNPAKKNVSDLVIWGNGDSFKLLYKASSEREGWMKSTKALEIPHAGCVVQVTTQQRNEDGTYALAEAAVFVKGAKITEIKDAYGLVTARSLEPVSC